MNKIDWIVQISKNLKNLLRKGYIDLFFNLCQFDYRLIFLSNDYSF